MELSLGRFEKAKGRPLHEQVREHLRQHYLYAQPDVALPALRHISEAMGVNHITITKALRDLEAEGLLNVIPGRGTFVTKVEAVHRSIEMLTLCTSVGGLMDTFQHTFRGMEEKLPDGFSLLVSSFSMPPVPKAEVFLQRAKARNTAALALFDFEYLSYPDSELETQLIRQLAEQMPVVLVGKEHTSLKLDCIFCDPAPEMQTFLEECYEEGARRFQYLGVYDDQPHLKHRLAAFEEFICDRDLPWQKPLVGIVIENEIRHVLDCKPDVVVVSEPWSAHRLVFEAQGRGLQLGSDLQILCFSGSLEQVRAIEPYISVVLLEEEEVGRCVMEHLQQRLSKAVVQASVTPVTRLISGKLVRQCVHAV